MSPRTHTLPYCPARRDRYLVAQRALSPRTVACYRDALRLFLDFASRKLGKAPTALRLVDIQPDLILAFLDHLEHERHNSVRSRNLRLRVYEKIENSDNSMDSGRMTARLNFQALRKR